MPELYLRFLNRILTPVLLLLSLYLLLRGHNLPGGGFIAGLMAAAAFQLQILSRGHDRVRRTIGPYLNSGIGLGLAIAICSGIVGLLDGFFFKGVWFSLNLPLLGYLKIGTPVIFDLGVFLVVVSVATSYLLGLSRVSDAAALLRRDTDSPVPPDSPASVLWDANVETGPGADS
ncbi:MAG: Na(+)/H(+) antiporter subunit B [Caldilineaceae bacterium SB0664_bin_27]|uniref:Na(+)/H(+) antiporter subunit B n=1 Tax=Caldilineaceae bacterium SB0664_bin_27 TaxID=2605260 RepID=A0A6B0YQH3_9CHLR|nr:Na(+)/H(+) antiporter subunit B [Caldilineaceae bacterium SB0664_bin_27]